MMNGLQAVDSWDACEYRPFFSSPGGESVAYINHSLPFSSIDTPWANVSNLFSRCHRRTPVRAVCHRSLGTAVGDCLWKYPHDNRRGPPDSISELYV